MRQVRRALFAVVVLGGFANVLLLATPLYALHALDSVVGSAASLEALLLLSLTAAAALVTLSCVEAARERVLLRAGLWLDHTLGQSLLENGARLGLPPSEIKQNADAAARVRDALLDRSILPAIDAPWLPFSLGTIALLDPALGAVAATFAALLLLTALMQRSSTLRLAQQAETAAGRTEAWWLAQTASAPFIGPGATDQWERFNRVHVASAYALEQRCGRYRTLARLLVSIAPIAMIAAGAWLILRHELSLGVLVACVLIVGRMHTPLEAIAGSLGGLRSARAAFRRLETLHQAAEQRDRPAAAAAPANLPRLNVRAPLAAGYAAVLLFFGIGVSIAATAPLDSVTRLVGSGVFESRVPVKPARGGTVRFHVSEGASVRTGDLLATLDTAELDRQIAQLKTQADAAKLQLTLVSMEAETLNVINEPQPVDRTRLQTLEMHMGDLKRETAELLARIADAEHDLARSEIRAPASGRVALLAVSGPSAVIAPGATLLEIARNDNRSLLRRLVEPMMRNLPQAAQAQHNGGAS